MKNKNKIKIPRKKTNLVNPSIRKSIKDKLNYNIQT